MGKIIQPLTENLTIPHEYYRPEKIIISIESLGVIHTGKVDEILFRTFYLKNGNSRKKFQKSHKKS